MQRLIGELIANYDDEKYYCFNSVNMFTPLDEKYNLKYILAILNSELMNLYFKKRFSGFSDFTNNITQGYLNSLPIHIPTKQEHTNLITLVNKILGLHKQNIEYNEILNNFELILEDISITKLSEFPQVKFDISSNELKALKLSNNIVLLNSNDKIICENKIIARYIYYYLLSYEKKLQDLKDLKKEIMNIKIPEKLEDIQKILILYKNIKEKLKKLPEEIKKLEENINKAVFSLYKLSGKDINSIKSYLY